MSFISATKLMAGLVVAALLSISDAACLAQSNINDPLKNAKIWQLLESVPADSALWASYLGKPWIAMTYEEKNNIADWQSMLRKTKSAMASAEVFDNADDEDWGEEAESIEKVVVARQREQLEGEQKEYVKQLEKMYLKRPAALSSLQDNILANFIIIEDVYKDEFKAMGVDYRSYSSVHPGNNYSKEAWVRDKLKELMMLKRKQFEDMKQQMLSASK